MNWIFIPRTIDRIAMGMTLSASVARNYLEIAPNVWAVAFANGASYDSRQAFERLFGLPAARPRDGKMNDGAGVLILPLVDMWGFAPDKFWAKLDKLGKTNG